MHPSALRQRLWPYSSCFLDIYLVCYGGGLTTKRRQPLWTSIQNSESMRFRTYVYFFLFWFSSHLIPRPDHVSDRSCGDFIINSYVIFFLYFSGIYPLQFLLTFSELTAQTPVNHMPVKGARSGGLAESMVSTISGPPPETTQDRTHKGNTPSPRIEIKVPDPTGIKPGSSCWKAGRTYIDHATETNNLAFRGIN